MEIHKVIRKSTSGSTKWTQTVYFSINDPKTYAASVLLNHYYWELDADNVNSIANRMRMVGFSRAYLTKKLNETGDLCCSYCPKTKLKIELNGMKVPNAIKATIDHIIPISKGGDLFNYDNITVACGSCNSKKGSKSVEEFIKSRQKPTVLVN